MFIAELAMSGFSCSLLQRDELHRSLESLVEQAIKEGKEKRRDQGISQYTL